MVRRQLLALLFFAGAAFIVLYWPLLNAATHTGSDFPTDYHQVHWNYWWMRHALTTPDLMVFETDYVLFPSVNNLAYHTLTPFWFSAWAVLEPLAGTLLALNILFVLALALTGCTMYLLLLHEGVPRSFALVGGLMLELTPAMLLSFMVSHINYLTLFWYPLVLLLWGRVAANVGNRRVLFWVVALGLAFYGLLMTDYQHGLFVTFLLVPYGLLTLAQAGGWQKRVVLAAAGMLSLVILIVLLWFAGPLPYLLAFDRAGLSPQPLENAQGIAFPLGYISRQGTWTRTISLGFLIAPLVLLALAVNLRWRQRDRMRWFWLILVPVPLLLSLGPYIQIGPSQLAMPYIQFHEALGGLFRVPARFAPVVMIPALVFVGRTFAPHWPSALVGRLLVGGALVLVVMGEAFTEGQMPIQPVRPQYDFYRLMGQEQGEPYNDYVVLEVPNAGGSGEAWVGELRHMETQFYGVLHGKRMLNGTLARVPLDHFWPWLYDDPLLSWLGQRRFLEPELVEPLLRERINEWPIGYVVVHQDMIGIEGPTNQEIIGYFNSLPDLLCPVFVEGPAVAYRTAWHPDGCPPRTPPKVATGVYEIDLGVSGDERFIGWGWHWPEAVPGGMVRWTGAYEQASIYVDLPPGCYRLEVTVQSFHRERMLSIRVNDTEIGSAMIPADGLTTATFDLPAALVADGQHVRVELDYDVPLSPADVGLGEDARKLALMVGAIGFEACG